MGEFIGFGGEKIPVGLSGVSATGSSSSRRHVPEIALPGDILGANLIFINYY